MSLCKDKAILEEISALAPIQGTFAPVGSSTADTSGHIPRSFALCRIVSGVASFDTSNRTSQNSQIVEDGGRRVEPAPRLGCPLADTSRSCRSCHPDLGSPRAGWNPLRAEDARDGAVAGKQPLVNDWFKETFKGLDEIWEPQAKELLK